MRCSTTDFKTIDFFCGVGGLFLHANVKNLLRVVKNLYRILLHGSSLKSQELTKSNPTSPRLASMSRTLLLLSTRNVDSIRRK